LLELPGDRFLLPMLTLVTFGFVTLPNTKDLLVQRVA
jgi:hypothetical protein